MDTGWETIVNNVMVEQHPCCPMGNGQVERFNQTLAKMLGTLEDYQKSDWKAHVPTLVHAYNSSTLQSFVQLAIDFQLDWERYVDSYRSASDEPVTIYHNNIFIDDKMPK